MPSCGMAVLCSCIAMGRDPTQSTFVYSNHLYVNDRSKYMSGMFMRSHAKSCIVMQCMQGKQAGWVTHLLGQFYSPVAMFFLYSGFFRWLEWSGCLPQMVSGIQIGLLCCFFRKRSLLAGHFRNLISSNIGFAQVVNMKGRGLRI